MSSCTDLSFLNDPIHCSSFYKPCSPLGTSLCFTIGISLPLFLLLFIPPHLSTPILLFIYFLFFRNHGHDVGRVLAGIQVPPEEREAFAASLDKLGYRYSILSLSLSLSLSLPISLSLSSPLPPHLPLPYIPLSHFLPLIFIIDMWMKVTILFIFIF